jgi:predicted RNase H-like HicB family nuclease
MKTFSAVIEQDSATGLYVGFVPGFPGAHSQGGTLDELQHNLHEVIAMLLEDPPSIDEEVSIRIHSACVRRPSD